MLVGDDPINQLHIEIDNRAFTLLALYQPMAIDLRAIVAALKIDTDLERVGDLAVNIAEAATRYLHLSGEAAHRPAAHVGNRRGMLRDALDAFIRRDVNLAQSRPRPRRRSRRAEPGVPRAAHLHQWEVQTKIEASLDLILVSRHLERIGDHATNIAEDVIFMVSAEDVRHAVK